MSASKKIFLVSDLHLGSPSHAKSLRRERHFVDWLTRIKPEAEELILLGDIFDFWFEYRKAVPKGYTRLLGKLAEFVDSGIPVHVFMGNHDLWYRDYFPTEIGATVHDRPETRQMFGRTFFLAHGDGLGPGDTGYKFIRKIFVNPAAQWAFHRLHPNFGIGLADYFSRRSRNAPNRKDKEDFGEKEFMLIFSREHLRQHPEIDYFVFGHRHFPKVHEFEPGKYYVNLGDWITHFTYLEVSEQGVELRSHPIDRPAGT